GAGTPSQETKETKTEAQAQEAQTQEAQTQEAQTQAETEKSRTQTTLAERLKDTVRRVPRLAQGCGQATILGTGRRPGHSWPGAPRAIHGVRLAGFGVRARLARLIEAARDSHWYRVSATSHPPVANPGYSVMPPST